LLFIKDNTYCNTSYFSWCSRNR